MADTGWLNYVNFEELPRAGSSDYGWSDPGNAEESDASYADDTINSLKYSDWLHAYGVDFDTAIPATSVIDGFQVRIERRANSSNVLKDSYPLKLSMSGSTVGDDKSSSLYWPYTKSYKTYGASDDDWGTGYDLADVQNSGFGVMLSVHNYEAFNRTAYVDHIQIKIYYTPPPVIEPALIPSGATFGSPTVENYDAYVEPTAIAPTTDFGNLFITREGDIQAPTIPSTEQFGTAVITREYVPKPFDLLRIDSIRVQISMVEKTESGSVVCTLVKRKNECLYSEQLNHGGSWTLSNCTITADDIDAPDGVGSADKIVEASDTAQIHKVSQSIASLTDSVDVTFSCYVKGDERSFARLALTDKAGATVYADCHMNYPNPTAVATGSGATAGVENAGEGFSRFWLTKNIASGGTTPSFDIIVAESDGVVTYDGDGSSGIHAWGAQVEEAADTIDYIPTTTVEVEIDASTPVYFLEEFIDIFSIVLTAQSTDSAVCIYIFKDAPYPQRFLIRVFDQDGLRIAKPVSWTIKGV